MLSHVKIRFSEKQSVTKLEEFSDPITIHPARATAGLLPTSRCVSAILCPLRL